MFMRPTIMVVFDGVTDLVTIVTPVRPDKDISADLAYLRAGRTLERYIKHPRPAIKPFSTKTRRYQLRRTEIKYKSPTV